MVSVAACLPPSLSSTTLLPSSYESTCITVSAFVTQLNGLFVRPPSPLVFQPRSYLSYKEDNLCRIWNKRGRRKVGCRHLINPANGRWWQVLGDPLGSSTCIRGQLKLLPQAEQQTTGSSKASKQIIFSDEQAQTSTSNGATLQLKTEGTIGSNGAALSAKEAENGAAFSSKKQTPVFDEMQAKMGAEDELDRSVEHSEHFAEGFRVKREESKVESVGQDPWFKQAGRDKLKEHGEVTHGPARVLDRRERRLRNCLICEYLVAWHGRPLCNVTWETAHSLHVQYPDFTIADDVT